MKNGTQHIFVYTVQKHISLKKKFKLQAIIELGNTVRNHHFLRAFSMSFFPFFSLNFKRFHTSNQTQILITSTVNFVVIGLFRICPSGKWFFHKFEHVE